MKSHLLLKSLKKLTFTCLCGALLIGTAFETAPAQKMKSPAPSTPRFVHAPDLKTLLPRFLTAQGYLDPKFAEATAKPDAYYSDFYGIQALADTTRDDIRRDFVPKYAEIAGEDENSLTLKFKSGWTGKFFPHSLLKAAGQEVPYDHVEVSGATWAELLKNLADFRGILQANKWEKRYLIPNPFYKEELIVAKQMASKTAPVQPVYSETLAEMQREKNALLIYPEGVHGDTEGYQKFKTNVLDKYQFDWIAMEMLSPTMQRDLDVFVKAADGSPEYLRTRKVLLDYFTNAWNGRKGPKTTAEENYYFKIVEQMRARKTRIIGIESTTIPYIFYRYGENKFGAAVRSYQWAKALPKTGRGIIFGGSGHFTVADAINLQDFQAMLNPKMKLYVMQPLKKS